MNVENEQQRQALHDALKKAKDKITASQGLLEYHIRREIGSFAETLAKTDIGLFDVVHGVSEEHGEFDFFALRIPNLMQDLLILPDGQMYEASLLDINPEYVNLDTLEYPKADQIIDERGMILMNLAGIIEPINPDQ
jgi:hypothetical protein